MPVDRQRLLRLAIEPYSRDTTPDAQAFLNRRALAMTVYERAARGFQLNQTARDMAVAGHLARDPTLTPRQAKLRVIRSLLGDQLFDRVYGEVR
jgi:hypothetical protein